MKSFLASGLGLTLLAAAIILLVLFFVFIIGAFLPSTGSQNLKQAEIKIGSGNFLVDVVERPLERAKGLSGRDSLPEFGGMLFRFVRPGVYSFWMKDMSFPIDILWLKDGRVVHLVENAEPPPPGTPDSELEVFRPGIEADEVLELSAGMIARFGIRTGDEVLTTDK